MGDNFVQFPEKLDPYALNLLIYNELDDTNQTITSLASQLDDRRRKVPLRFEGPSKVSVLNSNGPKDMYFDIVLYVVELATASTLTYSVYDSIYVREGGPIGAQNGELVTIMSAYPFTLDAPAKPTPSSLSLRLAGFDNAGDGNFDECPYAYKSAEPEGFAGFKLESDGPIATFEVLTSNGLQIAVGLSFWPSLDYTEVGFVTSPGYNGCLKPKRGGVQSFRTADYFVSSGSFSWNTRERYNMRMEVVPHLDAKHPLSIYDETNVDPKIVTGTAEVDLTFTKSNQFDVLYTGVGGDQGFLVRYAAALAEPRTSTALPTSTTASVPSTSSSSPQPTTSACSHVMMSAAALLLALLAAA